ncbi:MAG TPA: protein translocase subunit SecF, partial [Streptosporangiaceae bacterium]|nr:protein translocase subunit SecF [Streptosporangiaceae bacterium]
MSRLGSIGGRLYRGEVSVDFVGKRRMWYSISALIILVSLIAVLVRGLSFSVEFKGGAVFGVNGAPASVTLNQVQKAATDGGVSDAIVQHVGTGSAASWQVQTKELKQDQSNAVRASLANELNVPQSQVSVSSVSGSWGSQISQKATQALIAFLIVIVIYLSIAFEWKMAGAAFVALLHTLVITVGVYALTGFEVSPATVIGFLTI